MVGEDTQTHVAGVVAVEEAARTTVADGGVAALISTVIIDMIRGVAETKPGYNVTTAKILAITPQSARTHGRKGIRRCI